MCPIGATQFRIALNNYDFVGANTGKDRLCVPGGIRHPARRQRTAIEVIVGL